jgi:hypothetical protein
VLMRDGKQLTHVRVNERENRASQAKLADARFALLNAQKLVIEADADSREVTAFFDGLLRLIAPEVIAARKEKQENGRVGNLPRVITPDQPADAQSREELAAAGEHVLWQGLLYDGEHWRPEDFRPCVKCGSGKPRHRRYYEVYLSESKKGVKNWYWRRDCKECHLKIQRAVKGYQPSEEIRAKARKIREPILDFQAREGRLPTLKEICQKLGWHHVTVRGAWRLAAAEDEDFPRLPGK